MTIETIDELLDFIDTNYERLTEKAYIDICRSTMQLYEYKMPDTKEDTLERIQELYEFTSSYENLTETPLFLFNDN
jgi:peroxiredoxin family protein